MPLVSVIIPSYNCDTFLMSGIKLFVLVVCD